MRLSNVLYALVILLPISGVMADHTHPQGSVAALEAETQELVREVYYAPLHSGVKNAVNRFSYDVRALDHCVDHCDSEGVTDDHTSHGVPPQCYNYYSRVRNSFYPVERYLYDTYYDLPRVYRSYVDVRNSLYALGRTDQ